MFGEFLLGIRNLFKVVWCFMFRIFVNETESVSTHKREKTTQIFWASAMIGAAISASSPSRSPSPDSGSTPQS